MSKPVRQFSFSAGELSPTLYARTDLDRYGNGARTMTNMSVIRQGGASGRPGTEYGGVSLATVRGDLTNIRLIPFVFNETGIGQSYVLEFGDGYIAFYQNNAPIVSSTKTITGVSNANPGVVTAPAHGFSNNDIVVIDGINGMTQLNNGTFIVVNVTTNTFQLSALGLGINTIPFGTYVSGGTASKVFTISAPWLSADLSALNFAQSADVLTIVHPSYLPYSLSRNSSTSWTLGNIIFGASLLTHGVNTLAASGGGSGSANYIWGVTMVLANGDETNVANLTKVALTSINAPSATNPITLTWANSVAEPSYYKIYRADGALAGNASGFGYVGTVPAGQHNFIDTITSQDFTNSLPITSPFESSLGVGNYPSVVGFCQQRRFFAAWNNNPVGFAGSKPGSFSNFDVHTQQVPDDDPVFGSIAGEEVNAIEAITELKFMLMLTAGAELYIQGNGSGVVTPNAINASAQSQFGANALRPLKAGDQLVFTQALGSAIRDFAFDFAIDGYRGNDITIFSAHLFEGYQIIAWCYQKVPDSMIWAVRSDGVLLSCTYVREQQLVAWTKHEFTNGLVEDVCAIPENGEYAVYLAITRIIGGKALRYIERLSSRLWPDPINTPPVPYDPINASYLDCFLQYDGRNKTNTTMTLNAPITIVAGVNDGLTFTVSGTTYLGIIPSGLYTIDSILPVISASMNAANNNTYIATKLLNFGVYVIQLNNDGTSATLNNFPSDPNYARSAWNTLGFPAGENFGPTWVATTPPVVVAFDTSSTAYQQRLLITSSVAFFSSAMVGNQIFLEDNEWIYSQGKKGNQVRCTIQSYQDSSNVTVTPSEAVPVGFQAMALTTWARAVNSVSGLVHLEGQAVSIWADRFVVGSPLNPQVTPVYTVSAGAITLDKQYSVIYVGLPMVQDLESLDLESYIGPTMLAKRKRVSDVSVYVYNTRSFFSGGENPDTNTNNTDNNPLFELYEEKDGASQATYDVAPALMTKQDYTITPSHWSYSGRVFFRNVDPVPFTLLAIAPGTEDPVDTPYKRGG